MSNINDNPTYITEICALLDSTDLTDCFRNIHPNLPASGPLDWIIGVYLKIYLMNLKLTKFYQDSFKS